MPYVSLMLLKNADIDVNLYANIFSIGNFIFTDRGVHKKKLLLFYVVGVWDFS